MSQLDEPHKVEKNGPMKDPFTGEDLKGADSFDRARLQEFEQLPQDVKRDLIAMVKEETGRFMDNVTPNEGNAQTNEERGRDIATARLLGYVRDPFLKTPEGRLGKWRKEKGITEAEA